MTHTQASDLQRAWPSATLMTFPQLFADSRSFYIPAYQRPYDWGKSQRGDLLQDIERLERLALSSPEASHFCGTIICTPQKNSQDSFAIVDGQQRMTTLAILHAQLCRAVGKQTFISKLGSVRFSPQPQDEEVFANILNGGKPGETTTLAQSNYVAAASQLGKWVEARKSNAERLLKLIEHSLSFIPVREDGKQFHQIVSGSGTRYSYVRKKDGPVHTFETMGFTILRYYPDRSKRIEFYNDQGNLLFDHPFISE